MSHLRIIGGQGGTGNMLLRRLSAEEEARLVAEFPDLAQLVAVTRRASESADAAYLVSVELSRVLATQLDELLREGARRLAEQGDR